MGNERISSVDCIVTPVSTIRNASPVIQRAISIMQLSFEQNKLAQRQATIMEKANASKSSVVDKTRMTSTDVEVVPVLCLYMLLNCKRRLLLNHKERQKHGLLLLLRRG